jgi:hypothetical protein
LLWQDQPIIDALAAASIAKIRAFTHQNLANTVWAIATLNYSLTKKMALLIVEIARQISNFSAQGLANTAWAFAKME